MFGAPSCPRFGWQSCVLWSQGPLYCHASFSPRPPPPPTTCPFVPETWLFFPVLGLMVHVMNASGKSDAQGLGEGKQESLAARARPLQAGGRHPRKGFPELVPGSTGCRHPRAHGRVE